MKMQTLTLLGLLAAGPALADATAMCMDTKDADAAVCDCATEALADSASKEDRGLYDRIGTLYLAKMEEGASRGAAWTEALDEVAAENGIGSTGLLTRMNAVGKAHRAAMKSCAG